MVKGVININYSVLSRFPVFLLIIAVLVLVIGIAGCPEQELQIEAPATIERQTADFGQLPQLEFDRYENAVEFTLYAPSCVRVAGSGSVADKIDVTFLAEGYEDMEKFQQDVLDYIDFEKEKNGLTAIEPFKSNEDKFNFYFVNRTTDLECELGCFGIDRLVCCNDNKVKQTAAQCPSDEIFVLIDTKDFCGASKDYATVCTIEDSRAGLVLVHEFGHTFGGLGDEYSYGKSGDTNVPNCDVAGCSKWSGIPGTGCFPTCGYTNLFRATNRNSLMNIYIDNFGPVSTGVLIDKLSNFKSSPSTQELLAAVPIDKNYFTSLKFESGEIILDKVYVTNSTAEEIVDGEEYVGRILSFNDQELNVFRLKLPRTWYSFYDPAETEEENKKHSSVQPEKFNFTFNVPYFANGKLLEIFTLQGEKLDEIQLAPFAKTCGDNICQEHENYLECSADCPLSEEDNLCLPYQDNICDPDCPFAGRMADIDCNNSTYFVLVLIAIVAALIVLFGVKLRKGKK